MHQPFDAVKPHAAGLALQVANAFRRRIECGELAPGDRLPSERALLAQLGVSRPVLREALAMLEANGLLESQVGRGRFVCQPPDRDGSLSLVKNWLLAHRAEIADLNEIRCAIEPAAVAGAAADAWPEVIAQLEAVTTRAEQAIARGDVEGAAQLDGEFHKALISASQNAPLVALATGLIDLAEHTGTAVYTVPSAATASLQEHERLTELIRERRFTEASEALARHHREAFLRAVEQTQSAEAEAGQRS